MTDDHDRINKRTAPIAMDAESFRRAGHALVDSIAEFLETLPRRPVTPDESPDAVRGFIDADASLPEDGTDAGARAAMTWAQPSNGYSRSTSRPASSAAAPSR